MAESGKGKGVYIHGELCYCIVMKNFNIVLIAILAIAVIFMSECSRAAFGKAAYSMADYGEYEIDEVSSTKWSGTGFNATPVVYRESYDDDSIDAAAIENLTQNRKLTKRADLRIRVEDLESAEKNLSEMMEKYSSWPESSVSYDNSLNFRIRVPAFSYENMLADLSGLGRVLRKTENAEDVTLRYYDLESRLATKRELLKTYQGYLLKAKNIEEIMTVESRIADLQLEIDQTGTQFRNLVNQIDYSIISLDISGPISTVSYSRPTFGDKMGELFSSFGSVVSTGMVVITGIIIYGIPAILLIVFAFWFLFGRLGLLKKLFRLAAGKKKQ